ncbi:HPr family phosphocarrier protein [Fusibacter sp. JL216-2]|uniref:HPr family phosphocarrier protein n=1 Tax=Fusibacter sp. JL216-2 TaxID=3071453 RepID=UPI003D33DAD8
MTQVTIKSKNGLHARPASLVVNAATKFTGEVFLIKDTTRVNAKSIMNVMGMGLMEGDTITIEAQGDNSQAIETELKSIIEGVEA